MADPRRTEPVRPEYRQLARDFVWHADAVGWTPDARVRQDMGAFLVFMEDVDAHLDALVHLDERRRFGHAVLEGLLGRSAGVHDAIRTAVDTFGEVLARRGVTDAFVALAREGLRITEELRVVERVDDYLALVRREGRITTELALLAVGPVPERLARVFDHLGAIGNHVDELLDLVADHRGGIRVIGSGPRVRMALTLDLLRGALPLLVVHPRPIGVVVRGGAYLLGRFPA